MIRTEYTYYCSRRFGIISIFLKHSTFQPCLPLGPTHVRCCRMPPCLTRCEGLRRSTLTTDGTGTEFSKRFDCVYIHNIRLEYYYSGTCSTHTSRSFRCPRGRLRVRTRFFERVWLLTHLFCGGQTPPCRTQNNEGLCRSTVTTDIAAALP